MQVKESYGVSPGNKGAAGLVAQSSAPGPGVSTLSNLDSTRSRIVKRGCVVELPGIGGITCRVARVRLGYFWPDVGDFVGRPIPCCRVRVVA